MNKGIFITLEGIDGSGKSRLAAEVMTLLTQKQIPVVCTREPGGTSFAEGLRTTLMNDLSLLPWTTALLFLAARVEHVHHKIAPALHRGAVVVCERFHDSTIVYQGYAQGLGIERVEQLCYSIVPLIADHTFYIDLDVHEACLRRQQRGHGDPFEARTLAFYEKVREGYKILSSKEAHRMTLLDGRRTLLDLANEIVEAIQCHWA